MAKRRSTRNRLQVKVDENVTKALLGVQKSFTSTHIRKALHEGAQLIAASVRAAAPSGDGVLREGVYVASALGDEYRPLYRRRGKRQLVTKPLQRKPGRFQAVVKSSVFYGTFVQRGRTSAARHGFVKPNPFFSRGLRKSRKRASEMIRQQIEATIRKGWESGG